MRDPTPILLPLVLAAVLPTAAKAGAAPGPPDHVIVFDAYERHTDIKQFRRTVTRAGTRQRVDDDQGRGVATTWSNLTTGAYASLWRGRDSEHIQIYGPAPDQSRSDEKVETRRLDETEQLLGETCQVWETLHVRRYGRSRHLSCRTPDGIELWSKTDDGDGDVVSSVRAISLVRRPVRRSEVRPPGDLIARHRLFGRSASRPAPGWEVHLKSTDRAPPHVMRRSGAWTVEEHAPPLDGYTIQNPGLGLSLRLIWAEPTRRQSLTIQRALKPTAQPAADEPQTQPPDGIVLGEPCWIAKPPPVKDLDTGQEIIITTSGRDDSCYSRDGMLLRYHRGHRVFYSGEAVRFRRGPRSLDAILPKALPLSLKDWGLN